MNTRQKSWEPSRAEPIVCRYMTAPSWTKDVQIGEATTAEKSNLCAIHVPLSHWPLGFAFGEK